MSTSRYYASLCLIVKNEPLMLREWIDYHLNIIKFDHFYITDNNSDPPLSTVIQDYIDQGIVTYRVDTRTKAPQTPVYNDTLRLHGHETRWMGFIDCDEFIVLHKHHNIREFLQHYEEFGSLSVCWYLFGTSGHINQQPSGYATYAKRHPQSCHYKTIVQPARVISYVIHNVDRYVDGYFGVDEKKNRISGPFTKYQTTEYIQLNHYVLRSLSEFVEKMQRGRPDGGPLKRWDYFMKIEDKATIEDTTILRRIVELGGTLPLIPPRKNKIRLPRHFDWEAYLVLNAEVTAEAPFKNYAIYHWDRYGRQEQRKYRWESGNEKWIGYLDRYPDLRQNGITTKEQAIQHYLRKGKMEGRIFA